MQSHTYFLEFDDALFSDALFDPSQGFLDGSHITTCDGERFAVVVHEVVADAVTEDHGCISRELAVHEL